jgi:hypothetical protein
MADQSQSSDKLELDVPPDPSRAPLEVRVNGKGTHLAHVATAVTTPKADKSVKVVKCPTYRTLCYALFQLAEREDSLGTYKFCRAIINPLGAWTGEVINDHTAVVGGGDATKNVEDTEFRMEGTDQFFDTEYIEAGYALTRMGLGPDLVSMFYVVAKRTVESGVPEYIIDNVLFVGSALSFPALATQAAVTGKPSPALGAAAENIATKLTGEDVKKLVPKIKALVKRKSLENPPNSNGLWLGELIANNYVSIGDFTRKYCRKQPADAPLVCSNDPKDVALVAQLKNLPKLEERPPFVPRPPAQQVPPKKK